MKKLLLIIVPVLLLAACGDDGEQAKNKLMADSANYTRIQWLDSMVHFDTIKMGQQAQVRFRFRNIGDKPLYLTEVKAGCGCTVPDYTKGAIAPGMEGEVTGAFDSKKAHPGIVRKSIFVTTNTKDVSRHTLSFTGLILEGK
jgi:hypothetical protein